MRQRAFHQPIPYSQTLSAPLFPRGGGEHMEGHRVANRFAVDVSRIVISVGELNESSE